MSATLTRRALFGTTGAIVAGGALAAAPALATRGSNRDAWNAAVRKFETAEFLSEEFDRLRLDPVYATMEAEEVADPPLHYMAPAEDGWPAKQMTLNRGTIAIFMEPAYAKCKPGNPIIDASRRLDAEIKVVDAVNKANRDRLGFDALCDESERLGELAWSLRDDLIPMPAPDFAALVYKLRLAIRFDMLGESFADGEPQAAIMADTERLTGVLPS